MVSKREFRKPRAGGQSRWSKRQKLRHCSRWRVALPNCARRETHVRDLFELMSWHLWLKVTKGFIDSHFTAFSMLGTEKVRWLGRRRQIATARASTKFARWNLLICWCARSTPDQPNVESENVKGRNYGDGACRRLSRAISGFVT